MATIVADDLTKQSTMSSPIKKYIRIAAGALLLYLAYLSIISGFVGALMHIDIHLEIINSSLPMLTQQPQFHIASAVFALFFFALMLLGCVKMRPFFSVLPAFVLCAVWFIIKLSPGLIAFKVYPVQFIYYTPFGGGCAMALAFTGATLVRGLVLWIARKETPKWHWGAAFALVAVFVCLFVLDYFTPLITDTLDAAAKAALKTATASSMLIVTASGFVRFFLYPALIGGVSIAAFAHIDPKPAKVGYILLAVALATVIFNYFPYVFPRSPFSITVRNFQKTLSNSYFLPGLSSTLWGYMTGALITVGAKTLIAKAFTKLRSRLSVTRLRNS